MTDKPLHVTPKKILLVEDHPLFRAMLVQLINQAPGLTVCGETDNITEAMALIDQTRPDAAIVDLTLSGSNGLELLKNLKVRNLRLPVLALSMHAETLYAERALRGGAKAYLSKAASPAEVLATLRKVLAGEIRVNGLENRMT